MLFMKNIYSSLCGKRPSFVYAPLSFHHGLEAGFTLFHSYAAGRLFLALVKTARICYDKKRNAE